MIISRNKFARVDLPVSNASQTIKVSSDKIFSAYIVERNLLDNLNDHGGTLNLSEASKVKLRNTRFFDQIITGGGKTYSLLLKNNNDDDINLDVKVNAGKRQIGV